MNLYFPSVLIPSYHTSFVKLLSGFVVASLFSLLFSLLQHGLFLVTKMRD